MVVYRPLGIDYMDWYDSLKSHMNSQNEADYNCQIKQTLVLFDYDYNMLVLRIHVPTLRVPPLFFIPYPFISQCLASN